MIFKGLCKDSISSKSVPSVGGSRSATGTNIKKALTSVALFFAFLCPSNNRSQKPMEAHSLVNLFIRYLVSKAPVSSMQPNLTFPSVTFSRWPIRHDEPKLQQEYFIGPYDHWILLSYRHLEYHRLWQFELKLILSKGHVTTRDWARCPAHYTRCNIHCETYPTTQKYHRQDLVIPLASRPS